MEQRGGAGGTGDPSDPTEPEARDGGGSEKGARFLQRHHVGLAPKQAWRVKGSRDGTDEIVIPGLLLDDHGGSEKIEATMPYQVFCQLQAMAAIADVRMLNARAAEKPQRKAPEANVWLVEGVLRRKELDLRELVSLDRLVFDKAGQRCVDRMSLSQLMPGAKERR